MDEMVQYFFFHRAGNSTDIGYGLRIVVRSQKIFIGYFINKYSTIIVFTSQRNDEAMRDKIEQLIDKG
jgi:hypothetical protein